MKTYYTPLRVLAMVDKEALRKVMMQPVVGNLPYGSRLEKGF